MPHFHKADYEHARAARAEAVVCRVNVSIAPSIPSIQTCELLVSFAKPFVRQQISTIVVLATEILTRY